MRKLEREVEQPYADWVNNDVPEWWALKFAPPGRRGWPDRILLGPGAIVFFIEFKRPGEDLEPLQVHNKGLLEDLGFIVYVCESTKDAKDKTRAYF
jgi:hypothetical protein